MDIQVQHAPTQEELQEKEVFSWPIWEKEISEFPWTYDSEEICYFLEGEVEIESEGGITKIGAGDLVTFPQGLSCIWKVLKSVKKHYIFK